MQKKKRDRKKNDKPNETSLPVYCVCRSSDGERFMIACDRCEEWYHGDCINVTPKQAEQIKTFYCHQCRRKEPVLQIEYKSPRIQRLRSSHSSNLLESDQNPSKQTKKRPSSSNLSSNSEKAKSDNFALQIPTLPKTPESDLKFTSNELFDCISDCNGPSPSLSRETDKNFTSLVSKSSSSRFKIASPRARPCGSCSGCTRIDDCGKCDYCRDRRKFGGPNKIRQKCRFRQCVGSSHRRDPSNQNHGARRRKQHPGEISANVSPSHFQNAEADVFEASDFSPRNSVVKQHASMNSNVPGIKMRRGDMRGAGMSNVDLFSRFYQRLPLHASGDVIDFLDEDSDDDAVLAGLPHCAGPACMSAPVAGGRYCSESCRLKHLNSRSGHRVGLSRPGPVSNEVLYPYNLPYPDHLYCRHHRVYNWHSNSSGNANAYRIVDDLDAEDVTFVDPVRGLQRHADLSFSPGRMHQRIHTTHYLTSNGQLSTANSRGHPTLYNEVPLEDSMVRGMIPLSADLDFDVHGHASISSNTISPNRYYVQSHRKPTHGLRHVEELDDTLIPGLHVEASDHDPSHSANQFLYMSPYQDVNQHHSDSSFLVSSIPISRSTEPNACLPKSSVNHRQLHPEAGSSSNGLESSYFWARSFTKAASNPRHSIGATAITDRRLGSVTTYQCPNANVTPSEPLPYLLGPDEFYTINDSDDIEINWPQESLSGLNV